MNIQKLMLKDFAGKNGIFQYEYDVDDGYTGCNVIEPSGCRALILDHDRGDISCVLYGILHS